MDLCNWVSRRVWADSREGWAWLNSREKPTHVTVYVAVHIVMHVAVHVVMHVVMHVVV